MKKICLLATAALFFTFFNPAQAIGEPPYNQPYGYGPPSPYGYGYGYGVSNDNPIARSVDNNYNTQLPFPGYAGPPRGSQDFNDPYHAEMEAKARQLNMKKMDRALKNEDREDRADGRRETRDKMYTGREGMGTVDKAADTVRNVNSLIRSFR